MEKIAIFGAGNCGRLIARKLIDEGKEIVAFIDNDPQKEGEIVYLHEANSSLGETFRPFENFEHSQTHSLASHPKFSKEAKASTANTRILGESVRDSMESNAESLESSLRGDNSPKHALRPQLTHTCKSKKSCEAQPNLAILHSTSLNGGGYHNLSCQKAFGFSI